MGNSCSQSPYDSPDVHGEIKQEVSPCKDCCSRAHRREMLAESELASRASIMLRQDSPVLMIDSPREAEYQGCEAAVPAERLEVARAECALDPTEALRRESTVCFWQCQSEEQEQNVQSLAAHVDAGIEGHRARPTEEETSVLVPAHVDAGIEGHRARTTEEFRLYSQVVEPNKPQQKATVEDQEQEMRSQQACTTLRKEQSTESDVEQQSIVPINSEEEQVQEFHGAVHTKIVSGSMFPRRAQSPKHSEARFKDDVQHGATLQDAPDASLSTKQIETRDSESSVQVHRAASATISTDSTGDSLRPDTLEVVAGKCEDGSEKAVPCTIRSHLSDEWLLDVPWRDWQSSTDPEASCKVNAQDAKQKVPLHETASPPHRKVADARGHVDSGLLTNPIELEEECRTQVHSSVCTASASRDLSSSDGQNLESEALQRSGVTDSTQEAPLQDSDLQKEASANRSFGCEKGSSAGGSSDFAKRSQEGGSFGSGRGVAVDGRCGFGREGSSVGSFGFKRETSSGGSFGVGSFGCTPCHSDEQNVDGVWLLTTGEPVACIRGTEVQFLGEGSGEMATLHPEGNGVWTIMTDEEDFLGDCQEIDGTLTLHWSDGEKWRRAAGASSFTEQQTPRNRGSFCVPTDSFGQTSGRKKEDQLHGSDSSSESSSTHSVNSDSDSDTESSASMTSVSSIDWDADIVVEKQESEIGVTSVHNTVKQSKAAMEG